MGIRQELTIVNELPDYFTFPYCRVGSFTLTTREQRFVKQEDVITHHDKIDTIASHFRSYFQGKDTGKKNPPANISYLYYACPSKWPNARYYDISRAYLQVARAFGLQVFIKEGTSVYYGDDIFYDELFETQRIARGLLVSGTSENNSFEIWDGVNLSTKRVNNSLYSPHLRASINYTLHSVVHMLKRYIVYANTDGFIVPSLYYSRVETFLDNWNIKYKIKHEGTAEIKTRGTYRIGSHETGTWNMWPAKSCEFIVESKPLWWLQAFQKGLTLHN